MEHQEAIRYGFKIWPKKFILDNYLHVLENDVIFLAYRNTVIRTVLGVTVSITLIFMTAYPFAHKTLPLNNTAFGHLGDTRAVGDGIYELRVHHGPGYRIYFVRTVASAEWVAAFAPSALEQWAQQPPIVDGSAVVVLLCGGNKGSQQQDIRRAKRLVEDWR